MSYERWADDGLDDNEYPDEWDEDDDTEVFACPACGADVFEDSPRCPRCGRWVAPDAHPFSGRPTWWVALGMLGVIAVICILLLAST